MVRDVRNGIAEFVRFCCRQNEMQLGLAKPALFDGYRAAPPLHVAYGLPAGFTESLRRLFQ
jgi:hypothetical protein